MHKRRTFIGFTLTLGLLGSLVLWRQAQFTTAQAATGSAYTKLPSKANAGGLAAPLVFATFTVTNTGDNGGVNPVANAGTGTLRQAIVDANASPGADAIVFDLGAGTPSIALAAALPTITDPVTLSGNTGGATRVELNGAAAGGSANGLLITAGSSTIEGLVINRFRQHGILLQTNGGNIVRNCYVGTNASGTAALGNTLDGVRLESAPNNTIGGTTAGERNIISGNGRVGLWIIGVAAAGNKVSGNYIGTDVNGTAALGNFDGMAISAAPNNTIGGTTAAERNVISGNRNVGLNILNATATGNKVSGNYIGTDVNGTAILRNVLYGVYIDSAPNNTIGGTTVSERNLISGNSSVGVFILGATATGNKVSGNYIGTDVNGTAALGNFFGVQIRSSNTTLGGTTAGERNVISGNRNAGVYIVSAPTPASGNIVSGNYIGTDVTGTTALGNAVGGIRIEAAPNNTIGGGGPGTRNLISGNGGSVGGLFVTGILATGNVISGNYIGTDVTGTAAIPNAFSGIYLGISVNDLLIGTNGDGVNDLAERNLISGNINDGITFGFTNAANPFNVTVAGNYIGTDVSGTFALPNSDSAVYLNGSGHRIGTNSDGINDAAERNLLSGNRQSGVTLSLAGIPAIDTNNLVAGNYIGTQADGVSPLGNGYAGVRVLGAGTNSNTIGGILPAARNVIAFNGNSADVTPKAGILDLTGGPGNAFRGNAIFANTGLGIDLGTAGLTANDPNDTDTGPNQLQNYPVLSAVSPTGVVSGSLDSTLAAAAYPVRLEFFANSTCDPSDHGEGEVFLGAITVNGPGNFTTPAFALPAGKPIVTATATDTNGNTSEFSACCALITLGPASLANGVQGTAYNQAVVASPAGGNYTYAVTTNILPPGLSLNPATGAITGTPSAPGNYTFVITATGWGVCTGSQAYNLLILGTCTTITVNPASLPSGTVGTVYPNQTLTATGGTAPYTFSLASGALPPGLTLDANTGVINGTPTAGGVFTPTIRATGQGGCTGQRLYVISITCAAITINPATLPAATAGVAYSQQLTANVASTFSLQTGSLPPGLNLSAAGLISGVTTQTGSYNFAVKVLAGTCTGTRAYTLTVSAAALLSRAALAQMADYDGDGKSDFALWSNGLWRITNEAQRTPQSQSWGTAGDVSLLGDYDADGKTDLAVFRPGNGTWYVKRSGAGGFLVKAWGLATDVPVPGDYDGDGQTDLAVFRPSEGHWLVWRSSDEQYQVTAWGAGYAPYYDVAVPGDYDGDGRTDLAVFRRATGTWLIRRSSDEQFVVKTWGVATDVPVPADYDGDGQTDLAVWRGTTGTWYIWQSARNAPLLAEWGANYAPYFDRATPGDYDGDGQADLAVWRVSDQTWYVRCSANNSVLAKQQGQVGDAPVSAR